MSSTCFIRWCSISLVLLKGIGRGEWKKIGVLCVRLCVIQNFANVNAEETSQQHQQTSKKIHQHNLHRWQKQKVLMLDGLCSWACALTPKELNKNKANLPATCSVAFRLRAIPQSFSAVHQYTPASLSLRECTTCVWWKQMDEWETQN